MRYTQHWELEVIDTDGVSEYVQDHDTEQAAVTYGEALMKRYSELTAYKVTLIDMDWSVV
jgi:hypothetical protein